MEKLILGAYLELLSYLSDKRRYYLRVARLALSTGISGLFLIS
jgi:hypothetical protein